MMETADNARPTTVTTLNRDWVRDFTAQMDRLRQRRQAALALIAATTGSAESADGAVTVTAAGVLTSVSLSPGVQPGPALAGRLLQASGRARQRALDSAVSGAADILGTDSRVIAVLRRQADESADRQLRATPASRDGFEEVNDGD
jgi:hypothetical protein